MNKFQLKNKLVKATAKASAVSLISCISFFTASSSQAAIINGGFEDDFNGWETIGNTSIETSAFGSGPVEGNNQALLSTGGNTSTDSEIEAFLGLEAGSLDSLGNGNATAGSAIKQTFTANAGDTVSFQWNFLTNEATPTFFNDFAFVSLVGLSELADTVSTFSLSPTSFDEETGFQTFSFDITTTGTYTLGLGVIDSIDLIVDSALIVDNVSVPEPLTGLGALTATGFGLALRRKKNKSKN